MIKEVVACLQAVHGRAAGAVEEWQKAHRRALERRREQERYRGLLRTVVRAWREEADGRKAMSLRVALPRGVNVQAGAHPSRMDTDVLSTVRSSLTVRTQEGAAMQRRLQRELVESERQCEGGSGVLPVARSAVPAGTRARLLLTYVRLVEGGRLQRRRRAGGRANGGGTPGAARADWSGRVARVQRQAELEGLVLPAAQRSRHVSEQETRRRERAIRQWEREKEVRVDAGQGANAGGARAEGGAVAAASAALSPAQDVAGGEQRAEEPELHDASRSTCDGQRGNVANVSAEIGERLEEGARGGMVQGSNGAMGNADGGGACAAGAGRMASGHGSLANGAPVLAQHGEPQQDTYSTVPALLQHTTLKLVLRHEDEEQEQHEQIANGVEGTPDGTAQQHGGSSSANGGQQVGDGAAGLYVLPASDVLDRQRLTSGEYDTTVAAGENEDATGVQGGATGAEAGTEPSESQGHGHGGGMAGVGAALPPGRHPKHGDG